MHTLENMNSNHCSLYTQFKIKHNMHKYQSAKRCTNVHTCTKGNLHSIIHCFF